MIDTTDPVSRRALAARTARASRSSTPSTSRTGSTSSSASTPLARTYGAALIVGCIDEDKEQAQAITRERKLEIAAALVEAADRGLRHPRRATSSSTRSSSPARPATRTTSAAPSRRSRASGSSRKRCPHAKTVLGISNVSFGLPDAGREVLNSVFLYHCTKAGPRPRHRPAGEARTLRLDPRRRAQARRGPAVEPRRRSDRRLRRALPRRGSRA